LGQIPRFLNLGCGPYKIEGYINIDQNSRQKPDLVRDVRKGLPFDDESVDGITASHFLEHLDHMEMLDLLEECWRVLKPKSQMKIVVPIMDFSSLDHKQYLSEDAFDIFGRDAAEYYDRKFAWTISDKAVRTNSARRQNLHLVLEK
jgi:predicted SAM-dependent methyltransferase